MKTQTKSQSLQHHILEKSFDKKGDKLIYDLGGKEFYECNKRKQHTKILNMSPGIS